MKVLVAAVTALKENTVRVANGCTREKPVTLSIGNDCLNQFVPTLIIELGYRPGGHGGIG
jgi:hypothetical protein